MHNNIGKLDQLLRLFIGLFALSSGIMRRSCLLILMGAFVTAEGISRFCPFLYVLDKDTH